MTFSNGDSEHFHGCNARDESFRQFQIYAFWIGSHVQIPSFFDRERRDLMHYMLNRNGKTTLLESPERFLYNNILRVKKNVCIFVGNDIV